MTMTLVETVTVGSGGAANIEFTSIPQTGTDLLVVLSIRDTTTSVSDNGWAFTVNNNSTGYVTRSLQGTGSARSSTNYSGSLFVIPYGMPTGLATSNTFGNNAIYLPNYTSATAKSFSIDGVAENNATASGQAINAGSWSGTSAITSLQLLPGFSSFAQYSTASLYLVSTTGATGATVS